MAYARRARRGRGCSDGKRSLRVNARSSIWPCQQVLSPGRTPRLREDDFSLVIDRGPDEATVTLHVNYRWRTNLAHAHWGSGFAV